MKTMKLETNDDGYLEPVDEDDVPIFRHCCEGSIAVTWDFYQAVCEEVFLLHDIQVEIIPRHA